MANDIPSKKREGGWAGLIAAKIKLILANAIPSKKIEDRWAGLVLAKIRLILVNDISSEKIGGKSKKYECNDKSQVKTHHIVHILGISFAKISFILEDTNPIHPPSLFLEGISFAKISLILPGTNPTHPPSLFLQGMSFAKISFILAGTSYYFFGSSKTPYITTEELIRHFLDTRYRVFHLRN